MFYSNINQSYRKQSDSDRIRPTQFVPFLLFRNYFWFLLTINFIPSSSIKRGGEDMTSKEFWLIIRVHALHTTIGISMKRSEEIFHILIIMLKVLIKESIGYDISTSMYHVRKRENISEVIDSTLRLHLNDYEDDKLLLMALTIKCAESVKLNFKVKYTPVILLFCISFIYFNIENAGWLSSLKRV